MWNFISSFFGKNNIEDLSLENACNILKNQQPVKNSTDNYLDKNVSDNVFSNKVGCITQITTTKIVVDNLYPCDKNEQSYELGQKVMYDLLVCDGKERAINVNIIESEWDLSDTANNLWNNRILICKVEKRVDRNLFLSPGELVIDMNKMSLDFLPMLGDWLEVDVKCAVNENVINLTGKVIEINKVSPVRPHVEEGKITNWNGVEWTGTINRTIFFNKQSLDFGYVPVVGDKVVAEVIESEQNRCSWRALKIIPQYIKVKTDRSDFTNFEVPNFKDDYPGLIITGLDLTFDKLNTTKKFAISVLNTSDKVVTLKNAEFLNNNSQCKVVEKIEKEFKIFKKEDYKLSCECIARNIGQSKEFLLLTFETFNIGKWLNISVSIDYDRSNSLYERKSRYRLKEQVGNDVLRAHNSSRFRAVQIPNYTVPQRLIDTVSKYEDADMFLLIDGLKVLKPVLFNNLAYTNFEDKFHTLIYLDEIANLLAIKNYDQEKACFIPNGEHFMLEIENLSERRPSIVIGDRVYATDPTKESKTDFEGIVEKVGAKHIFIKFPQLLHDQYTGEDYSIKIIPARLSYRKLHHAVYLAVRNLGPELLFPSKLLCSKPQVQFEYGDIPSNENISSEASFQQVQLDWYNKKLNVPQQNAVINILQGRARPLPYIIFGPPGTGKTVTIIETIFQIIRLIPHARLLVTAPSNSAADLIALRLIDSGILKPGDLVRLVSYNYALSDNVPCRLVPYCATGTRAKEGTANHEVLENGIHLDCSQAMIGRHRITVSTCSSASQLFLMGFPKGHFSHIIVDEAAQASEPEVLIPLSFLDKTTGQIILAGDPLQLGPVILCKVASQCGLNESYLERIINRFPYVKDAEGFPDSCGYDPKLVTKLVYNYRSLPDILGLYSTLFYFNELISTIDDENSEEANLVNKLCELLPKTNSNKLTRLLFHGVEGENYQTPDSPSWFNPHEAAQVFFYINELYRLGLNSKNIGIITPYIKQAREIRSVLTEAEFDIPKIGTVEEFQGQEFDVIILSTVRSRQDYIPFDLNHSLGFVASPKRLNVAISRAKSLLIVIGNPNILCTDTYWRSVVKYCMEKGCYTGFTL